MCLPQFSIRSFPITGSVWPDSETVEPGYCVRQPDRLWLFLFLEQPFEEVTGFVLELVTCQVGYLPGNSIKVYADGRPVAGAGNNEWQGQTDWLGSGQEPGQASNRFCDLGGHRLGQEQIDSIIKGTVQQPVRALDFKIPDIVDLRFELVSVQPTVPDGNAGVEIIELLLSRKALSELVR